MTKLELIDQIVARLTAEFDAIALAAQAAHEAATHEEMLGK